MCGKGPQTGEGAPAHWHALRRRRDGTEGVTAVTGRSVSGHLSQYFAGKEVTVTGGLVLPTTLGWCLELQGRQNGRREGSPR